MTPQERAQNEWDSRVRLPEGVTLLVEYRPPRKGEKYITGDYIVQSIIDWHSICLPVVVGTITPA